MFFSVTVPTTPTLLRGILFCALRGKYVAAVLQILLKRRSWYYVNNYLRLVAVETLILQHISIKGKKKV